MTHKYSVVVADDDKSIRTIVVQTLSRAGYDAVAVSTGTSLWRMMEQGEGDVVICDVILPDANGIELVPQIHMLRPNLPIIIMSAQNTLTTAVSANQSGAYEYLPKPFDINILTELVNKAVESRKGRVRAQKIGFADSPLVGRSKPMQDIYRVMAKLMNNDLSVLIEGESGTGKELVARALHDMGPRKDNPFVAINMAAIPENLIESELFGYEKGAFTGADRRKKGRFEEAQGGTIFLDEIGDMPFDAQTHLLRVLQQGEFRSVGGMTAIPLDVRIVAATNKDLFSLVGQGRFREDLYYRLNVVSLRTPSLRERREDIPELVEFFLEKAEKDGLSHKQITPDALKLMTQHSWPGNVRELQNTVRRLCALYTDDFIDHTVMKRELKSSPAKAASLGRNRGLSDSIREHLELYFASHSGDLPPDGLYARILQEMERPLFDISLKATNGNQIKVAKILGLNRNTVRKKLADLKISPQKY